MPSELLVCSSCGSRNGPARNTCLRCDTPLGSLESAPDESNQARGNVITVTKWALVGSIILVAIAIFYHFVITVPNRERAEMAGKREIQEQSVREAKIRAEEAAAERGTADAAWLAEQELRKHQATAQAQAQIERDLRSREERTIEYEVKRATDEKARRLQYSLSTCLGQADLAYWDRWNQHCSRLGLAPRCPLPGPATSQYDLGHRQTRDECYTRFNTFK